MDLDCGDHSCMFAVKKTGMRTNGGCRCLKELSNIKQAKVNLAIMRMRKRIKELEAKIEELKTR